MKTLQVIGEALIDLLPDADNNYRPVPGGSPFNVAIGCARQGLDTAYLGRLSTDRNGGLLLQRLVDSGVNVGSVQRGAEPSALAYVFPPQPGSLDVDYSFYIDGTAETAVDFAALARTAPAQHVHMGSFSAIRGAHGEAVRQFVASRRSIGGTVSYDLNARPAITPEVGLVRSAAIEALALADVIKVSDADCEFFFPGQSPDSLAKQWLEQGSAIVLYTEGSKGARCYCCNGQCQSVAKVVDVVDTVGAGDSFMAAFLSGLDQHNLLGNRDALQAISVEVLQQASERAARAASITVSRTGANPPTAEELLVVE